MKEDIFEISVSGEAIHGIWHKSICNHSLNPNHLYRAKSKYSHSKPAVIMLHGWAGYRTGPHDMLVKTARNLAGKGFNCFRFDFRGKGYSQGDRRNASNRTMLADLDAVLQFVNHLLDHPQIVLLGICSGAKLAFYYARNGNLPVQHVIEMSSPVLRQNEAESTLAVNQTKSALKGYAKKACRIETWKKLTGGEIHFQAVWRNITRPVKRLFVRKSKATVLHTVSQTKKKPFVNFKGQMLLIHGEKDPETQPALEQIQEMLQRYRIPSDVHIVKNANHSFYSIVWEKEIITLIADWLKNK